MSLRAIFFDGGGVPGHPRPGGIEATVADKTTRRRDKLITLLTAPGAPRRTRADLTAALGCDERTLSRDLKALREDLGLVVTFDRASGFYEVDPNTKTQQVRGLYFQPEELDALLVVYHLLQTLEEGLLDDTLAPLRNMVAKRLSRYGDTIADIAQRIRVVSSRRRSVPTHTFTECARATLGRRRIHMLYEARGSDSDTEYRIVSPQHLFRYRDNWYLIAWCHKRKGIRHFSLEQIQTMKVLDEIAEDVETRDLERLLDSGFGIFSGTEVKTAVIRFSPFRAKWVAKESWHPTQTGRFLGDGSWELRLPYANDKELVAAVMEYGHHAEVVEPPELREAVREELRETLGRYEG